MLLTGTLGVGLIIAVRALLPVWQHLMTRPPEAGKIPDVFLSKPSYNELEAKLKIATEALEKIKGA